MNIIFEILTDSPISSRNKYQGTYACAFYIPNDKDYDINTWLSNLPLIFNNPQAHYDDCRDFNIFTPIDQSFLGLVTNNVDSISLFKWILRNTNHKLVSSNIAYHLTNLCALDSSCVKPILASLNKDRFHCLHLRDMMLDVKAGGDIDSQTTNISKNEDHLNHIIGKTFKKLPPVYWEDTIISRIMLELENESFRFNDQSLKQTIFIPYLNTKIDSLSSENARIRASFALHLISHKGIKVDAREIHNLRSRLLPKLHSIEKNLVDSGFAHYKNDGKTIDNKGFSLIHKDNKAIQKYLASLPNASKTQKGNFEMSADALLKSNNQALIDYANFKESHIIKTYLPFLTSALDSIDHVVHPNFSHYSETGRVNGRDPNLLNLPREGGVRSCFVARDGFCLVFADYDGAEMRTFAQALLDIVGHSKLAEKYKENPNFDPHSYLVAEFMGISYDEAIARKNANDKNVKQMRQLMKAANFGFMGGLSSSNFGTYARDRYGVIDINQSKAMELYSFYMRVFPEVKPYFQWIKKQTMNQDGIMDVVLPRSLRVSGGKQFTQACNCFAQGVASDGALKALFDITEKCFDTNSSLFKSRPILFIHDEIITEVPIEQVQQASREIKSIMQSSMEFYTPDIPSSCSVALATRWYEGVDTVYDEQGNLKIWQPN